MLESSSSDVVDDLYDVTIKLAFLVSACSAVSPAHPDNLLAVKGATFGLDIILHEIWESTENIYTELSAPSKQGGDNAK